MEVAANIQAHFSEANGHLHPMISFPLTVPDDVFHRHTHSVRADQVCSVIVHTVNAPVDTAWSILRRFDHPQAYNNFVLSCRLIAGDGRVGSIREVVVILGQPVTTSTERLEILDDDNHVISYRIVTGYHRFQNYRSVTTLHATEDGNGTVVVESYVVDVLEDATKEETRSFADTFVGFNLQMLARAAQNLYRRSRGEGPQI